MPFVMRFPQIQQMVMVPTSMGLGHSNPEGQQPAQGHGHQAMYMAQANLPPHQPHPTHTPGPVPPPAQPPTPQNPGGSGGPGGPAMPNPPSTPAPTPPQAMIYSPMGGQPSLSQHLPQPSPHTAQSPHAPPYPGPAQGIASASTGGHHGGPGQQMATPQFVVAMQPHMMHHPAPPPHPATPHIPSSMPGFTPTSSPAVAHQQITQQFPYFPSKHPRFTH